MWFEHAKRQTRCRHSLRLETRENGKPEIALEIISARLDNGLIFCSLVFEMSRERGQETDQQGQLVGEQSEPDKHRLGCQGQFTVSGRT